MRGNLGGPAAAVACVFALPAGFEGVTISSQYIRQKETLGQLKEYLFHLESASNYFQERYVEQRMAEI